jgi:S-adenosylmethionine hydrolase
MSTLVSTPRPGIQLTGTARFNGLSPSAPQTAAAPVVSQFQASGSSPYRAGWPAAGSEARPATHVVPGLHFGARSFYTGPFDTVKILTDYGVGQTEETSNNEIKDRFNRVLDFTTKLVAQKQAGGADPLPGFDLAEWTHTPSAPGYLDIDSLSDIPGGNVDFIGLSLVRLGAAEPNNNLFIHVADPGVGLSKGQHDRTILVSRDHGVYVGPNNGSLGSLAQRLTRLGDVPKLYQIDFDKVTQLERLRLKDPSYNIPTTIHGRDVFAVVAGAIAAGLAPAAFAVTDETSGRPVELAVEETPFAQPAKLPTLPGEEVTLLALRDKTFSNLKLNVPLTEAQFDAFLAAKPQLEVRHPKTGNWQTVPVGLKFSDVPKGEFLFYHGSSAGVIPGTRNLELAIHLNHAGEALGIDFSKAQPLTIRLKSLAAQPVAGNGLSGGSGVAAAPVTG